MALATRNFTDLDLDFAAHPVTGDVTKKKGSAAVINSIKNLLLTSFYERPFQPRIGSNLNRLLFEQMDQLVASELKNEIELVIKNFEPRATVTEVNVIPDYDGQRYDVTVEFFLVNRADPIQVNLFLERVR